MIHDVRIDYEKSTLAYLEKIATEGKPNTEQFAKILNMLEILSQTATPQQWETLYKISLWDDGPNTNTKE